jgi:hypothetical protein
MGGGAAAVGGEGVRMAEAHGGTVGREAHPDLVIPWYYFYGVEMLFFFYLWRCFFFQTV